MTNKRKLHQSIIKTTVWSNKIKSKSRVDALSSSCGNDHTDGQIDAASDGEIDGVTISDMFGDETSGKSSGSKSYSGSLKKKTRKHREDASDFIIPSRPSAAAAAAGEWLFCCRLSFLRIVVCSITACISHRITRSGRLSNTAPADEALSIRDNKHVWLEDMVYCSPCASPPAAFSHLHSIEPRLAEIIFLFGRELARSCVTRTFRCWIWVRTKTQHC
jgi:hypothetical protein